MRPGAPGSATNKGTPAKAAFYVQEVAKANVAFRRIMIHHLAQAVERVDPLLRGDEIEFAKLWLIEGGKPGGR